MRSTKCHNFMESSRDPEATSLNRNLLSAISHRPIVYVFHFPSIGAGGGLLKEKEEEEKTFLITCFIHTRCDKKRFLYVSLHTRCDKKSFLTTCFIHPRCEKKNVSYVFHYTHDAKNIFLTTCFITDTMRKLRFLQHVSYTRYKNLKSFLHVSYTHNA